MEFPIDNNTIYYARLPAKKDLSLNGNHFTYNHNSVSNKRSIKDSLKHCWYSEFTNRGWVEIINPRPVINVGAGDFTFECWFKTNYFDYQGLFSKYQDGNNFFSWRIGSLRRLELECKIGGVIVQRAFTNLGIFNYSELVHVAMISNRITGNTIYVNLTPVGLAANVFGAGNITNTGSCLIGIWRIIPAPIYPLMGNIYEIRISNKARSLQELTIFHNYTRSHINKIYPHSSEIN